MNVMWKVRAAAIVGLGFALGLGGMLSAARGQEQAASAGVTVPKLELRDVKLENGSARDPGAGSFGAGLRD